MEVKKRKKKKNIFLIFILFILVCILICVIGFIYLMRPIGGTDKLIEFKIDNGMTVYNVGSKLKQENLIRNEYIYKIYVKLNNINEYKAGVYNLRKTYSLKEIVDTLSGNSYKKEGKLITFKEGKTINAIASLVSEKTNITKEEFLNKMTDQEYIDSLISTYWFLTDDIKNNDIYYPLEGYLYPETYSFNDDVKIEDIIKTMLDQTNKVLMEYKEDIDNSKYSIHELVTMASIIEKEGIYDNDRKTIAGVFYNRINKGMSLGSDVTTYYAFKVELGERDLYQKELNTYNAYNTRGPNMEGKLPVGAISNFGKVSFEAALYPSESDYLYFVADKSGVTHFTKTYSEHEKVIKELKDSNNWIEF